MAYGPSLKTTSTRKSKLKWLFIIVAVLAVLGAGGGFGYKWYQDSKAEDPVAAQDQQDSTQDEEVGVQDNQTATPTPSVSASPISSVPEQEQRAASSTGITITSPSSGATVKSGTKLEGTAPTSYTKVSYRIQSDERGLVGQGELNVVKGKYSGTIGSGGASGNGYIEVFVIDASGNEAKHTKVTVRLGG